MLSIIGSSILFKIGIKVSAPHPIHHDVLLPEETRLKITQQPIVPARVIVEFLCRIEHANMPFFDIFAIIQNNFGIGISVQELMRKAARRLISDSVAVAKDFIEVLHGKAGFVPGNLGMSQPEPLQIFMDIEDEAKAMVDVLIAQLCERIAKAICSCA